jgi:hypothetical protein
MVYCSERMKIESLRLKGTIDRKQGEQMERDKLTEQIDACLETLERKTLEDIKAVLDELSPIISDGSFPEMLLEFTRLFGQLLDKERELAFLTTEEFAHHLVSRMILDMLKESKQ